MKITVDDGTFANFVARPTAEKATGATVILLHDVYGVDDDIRSACSDLADQGLMALAPNLFWRDEPGVDVFSSQDFDSRRRMDLYNSYDLDRGILDVAAIVRALRAGEGASDKVGVLGFGLGGLLAYLAAARLPIDAAVSFYGIKIAQMLDEARKVAVPMLIHLGEEDPFIPPAARAAIKEAMASQRDVTIFGYEGCAHGFATRAATQYDAHATALAMERSVRFFGLCLK